jgi:iron(III) transport system permease protein
MKQVVPGSGGPKPAATVSAKAAGSSPLTPLLFSGLVVAVVLLPVVTLFAVAASGTSSEWPHLIRNVVPQAVSTTLILLALVALCTSVTGVVTAWAINSFEFPFRRTLSWVLVLPMAIPPYLAAYAFTEFFGYTGPIQTALRAVAGFESAREYWFPDIRSTAGAAFVLGSVLFPYVYLTTRVVFIMQGRNIADVARTLGASSTKVFITVLLPVARPAIIAGVALVLMETLNDIGAVEYLGVRTLTFAVYNTWLNRGSLEGAAQIACLMLVLVMALIWAEQWARRHQRFHDSRATQLRRHVPRTRLPTFRAIALTTFCTLPVASGFAIPVWVLGGYSLRRLDQLSDPQLFEALVNSVLTAVSTAAITILLSLVLINSIRNDRTGRARHLARAATVGYALPGTILGLGLLISLARADNAISDFFETYIGVSPGLIFTGTAAAIVYACSVRFLAVADSSVQSALHKLPHDIDNASRILGHTSTQTARLILLPLLKPAILTAAVIVFVDTVKELSATILLRPFGFNTLATLVYENASRGVVEDGANGALLIIAVAVIPVVLLSRALIQDREV